MSVVTESVNTLRKKIDVYMVRDEAEFENNL